MAARRTILLIEDNPDLRAATSDALKSLEYEVIVAAGTAPALEIARDTEFDLVVINAYPGRGRGLEILDSLRQIAPMIPAVVVSGFGDDPELRQRVESGDVAFLPIPFSLAALRRTIERHLERSASPERHPTVPAPTVSRDERRGRFRIQPWLAAAAGLIFVSGLILRFGGVTPTLPPPQLDSTLRGNTIRLLEPLGEVPNLPSHLVWQESPGAVTYRVVLQSVDETVLWQAETQVALIEIPQWLINELHPSVTYHWQVESFDENRSATARSDFAAFSARPRRRSPLSPSQPGREQHQGA